MIALKPLVDTWSNAIKAAEKSRQPFMDTAKMCNHFFTGSVGFMWSDSFTSKYLRGVPKTKFEITIAKAFELVSIVGPTLMWNYPGRVVTGYDKLEIPPGFWMDPQDPSRQQMGMMWQQEYDREKAVADTRNALMQHYLNYNHREQPGGGLKFDSQLAIIDALVKGRGCIRVDPYEPPGQTGTLTGGFYFPVDDLYIDPDCTRANLSNAKWIAIRHCEPHWEVERKFGWPAGSLKDKGTMTSKTAASAQTTSGGLSKGTSETNNLVVWFEIFSKCGVGTRFKDSKVDQWHDAFEESVGDYAYLCICKGMKEPLNVRAEFLETADMNQVRAALDWPTPYYMDNRWPVAMLDFWHQPSQAWPLAPLAMGLGELIFLNVFVSSLADRVFQDGLTKFAVRDELCADAVSKLLSYQHEVLSLNPTIAGNINELVSIVQRPQLNFDAFRMLEYISSMFDKRVGLVELLYGLNPGGKVSRTAADANIKGEAVSVRPEYMASQVESWQTEIANLDRIAAAHHVAGQTLAPGFGQMGGQLWDQLISQADPVIYMREMRCRIEANSIRKPNKAKDNQNIQQMGAYMLPVMQWYAQSTGNVEPLNGFIKASGNAIDQDVEAWLLPPIQPPQPSPEEQAAMQAEQESAELDKQRKVVDIQKKDLQNKQMLHSMMEQGQGLPVDMMNQISPEMPQELA